MLGELPARPGQVQIVAEPITDPAVLAAYARRIGPGEVLVEMDKGLVLGGARRMMDVQELRHFNRTNFTRTAYRWEALPVYEVASDGSDYGRYLAGEAEPTAERKQPWLDRLAGEKARGLYRHRVRLLHEPLHDYERYECEWGYVPNGAVGEDVRVLHLGEHTLPEELVDHDYWLLDDTHAVRMHYGATGTFEGATLEPALLDSYRAARDAAWALAEPFTDWWARHPELHRANVRKVS